MDESQAAVAEMITGLTRLRDREQADVSGRDRPARGLGEFRADRCPAAETAALFSRVRAASRRVAARSGDRRRSQATAALVFALDEPTAQAIRRAFNETGELAAVVELRRHLPLINDNEQARACVRTITPHARRDS